MYVFAGSMPPITSTTILIESSFKISSKLSVRYAESIPSLVLFLFLTKILAISILAPTLWIISSACLLMSLYTPVPTVPAPNIATLILSIFILLSKFIFYRIPHNYYKNKVKFKSIWYKCSNTGFFVTQKATISVNQKQLPLLYYILN